MLWFLSIIEEHKVCFFHMFKLTDSPGNVIFSVTINQFVKHQKIYVLF